MSTSDPLIQLAVISGAFGVGGEVKIKPFTQAPESCLDYGPLLDAGGCVILTPISARLVKNALAVVCEQVTTREQAEAMKGTALFVPRSALPAPDDEDDFYHSDLIGLQVKTDSGQNAGTIVAVHDFGSGDMIEIQPPKSAEKQGTWFHPFTKAGVPKVDISKGRLIIAMPEVINAKSDLPDEEEDYDQDGDDDAGV